MTPTEHAAAIEDAALAYAEARHTQGSDTYDGTTYAARQVLKAAISAALAAAPAQPVAQWVPVSERLPEPGEAVLLDIGMQTPIRALWAAKHTVETNDDDGEWGEYNEDDDAYYCPEGWYEWNEYEECHFAVDKGAPVAWMELPLPGKVAAPQPATAQEARKPLTDNEIWAWWVSENGLEDCELCEHEDFVQAVRAVEAKHNIT